LEFGYVITIEICDPDICAIERYAHWSTAHSEGAKIRTVARVQLRDIVTATVDDPNVGTVACHTDRICAGWKSTEIGTVARAQLTYGIIIKVGDPDAGSVECHPLWVTSYRKRSNLIGSCVPSTER
jgi:catabolite regulation protein CreA